MKNAGMNINYVASNAADMACGVFTQTASDGNEGRFFMSVTMSSAFFIYFCGVA